MQGALRADTHLGNSSAIITMGTPFVFVKVGRKLDRGASLLSLAGSILFPFAFVLSLSSEFFLIKKRKALIVFPHGHFGLGPFESVFSSSGKGVQFSLKSTSSARQFARPTPRDPKGKEKYMKERFHLSLSKDSKV